MKKIYILIAVFLMNSFSIKSQATLNAGFELWTTVPAATPAPAYDTPDNWNTLNNTTAGLGAITCLKASGVDVHSGSAALQLVTKSVLGQVANGIATTGTINTQSQSVGGGTAYTLRPDSIIGWYKYFPVSGDKGFAEILLLGSGGDTDTIGFAIFKTPADTVSSYTRFAEKINYRNSNPIVKSIWILTSSLDKVTHYVNSTIFIDDLQLGSNAFIASQGTGIEETSAGSLKVSVNPTSGSIIIQNPNLLTATVRLYNLTGLVVEKAQLSSAITTIDSSNLPDGIYVYSITDGQQSNLKTGKVYIQH